MTKIYKQMNEPYVGIYGLFRPILLVCDPQAVRNILIKDFQYFTDRMYKIFRLFLILSTVEQHFNKFVY